MSLTLYYHPLSSYCHKVLIALYEKGIEFEKRFVNLGDEAQRAELVGLWPIGKFPVMRDHDRNHNVAESSIIIEYLDHLYGGERSLIPHGWEDALQVRVWDRVFDNYLQGPMQQIVGDRMRNAKGDGAKERATMATAYGMIDRQMASKTWISGESFSMADCAAVPALFYSSALERFPQGYVHLHAYFDRLMERPSVQRVIEEAKPYFSLFPFAEAIPERYR
jgi:glutathione S-transferase